MKCTAIAVLHIPLLQSGKVINCRYCSLVDDPWSNGSAEVITSEMIAAVATLNMNDDKITSDDTTCSAIFHMQVFP